MVKSSARSRHFCDLYYASVALVLGRVASVSSVSGFISHEFAVQFRRAAWNGHRERKSLSWCEWVVAVDPAPGVDLGAVRLLVCVDPGALRLRLLVCVGRCGGSGCAPAPAPGVCGSLRWIRVRSGSWCEWVVAVDPAPGLDLGVLRLRLLVCVGRSA
ncbi:unnamed protein product [Leuciscus chuanchicus]